MFEIESNVYKKSFESIKNYRKQFGDKDSGSFHLKKHWHFMKLTDGKHIITIAPGYSYDIPNLFKS